jgi:hypothetical protein
MATLSWSYERDECWGPEGEPLLSASLRSDQLQLRLRNSRHHGLEVVITPGGSGDFDGDSDGPTFKVAFDDGGLHPLQARVQHGGEVAFVTDVRALVAELNCTNRLRLHARPKRGGVWWQLDASIDDLQLHRLVEPAQGIVLAYPSAERHVRAAAPSVASAPSVAAVPRRVAAGPAAAAPAPSAAADVIGAVAPLAAFAAGAKLANVLFGPGKRD